MFEELFLGLSHGFFGSSYYQHHCTETIFDCLLSLIMEDLWDVVEWARGWLTLEMLSRWIPSDPSDAHVAANSQASTHAASVADLGTWRHVMGSSCAYDIAAL